MWPVRGGLQDDKVTIGDEFLLVDRLQCDSLAETAHFEDGGTSHEAVDWFVAFATHVSTLLSDGIPLSM